jgi:hypothetical protein
MSKYTRRRLLIISLISTLATVFTVIAYANHSWGTYHWARTSNPFTLKLGDNVTSTWDAYLVEASNDWTQSSVLNTTVVSGQAGNPKRCRATNGRVEVCNSTYGQTGWLGVAQIWITGGTHITQAIVKLNDTYHNNPPYNSAAYRRFVMCQEVGHTFGLDHQDEVFTNPNLGSCMDYTNDPDGPPSNEHPNAHDYEQLELIYAHLDSTTTVGQSLPAAIPDFDLSEPHQWGRLIRGSREKGKSIYVREFAGGVKVFTFVTWAN